MAPLTHTLALLATAITTVAIEVVPLDMAWNSFDDQYLKCSENFELLAELQSSDFCKNDKFVRNWAKATAQWQKQGSFLNHLTQDEAVALMAITMKELNLYEQFNNAVRKAGSSSWKYRKEFRFKWLHFLLTRALQKQRYPDECANVFWGVSGVQYKVNKGDVVRFGQFALVSRSEIVAQYLGQDTVFTVYTCHGANIRIFSYNQSVWQDVLIPPFETFNVTDVREEGNKMHIELHSTGNSSKYDCEWLKGGSPSRNSPHLGGLLLATMAMAVVTGTL